MLNNSLILIQPQFYFSLQRIISATKLTALKKKAKTTQPTHKKNKPNQNTELQNIQHILVSRKRNLIVIRTTKKSLQCSKITITIQNSVLMEDKPGKLKTHTKEGHSYLH